MDSTPADLFVSAIVTCAQSIPSTAPTEVPLNFPPGIVLAFEIVIPAGHSGLTGIALGYGHNSVIPYGGAAFYSGDDDVVGGRYKDNTPGLQWSAFVCNNDLQSHTWEVRMALGNLVATVPSAIPATLPPALITAAGNTVLESAANVSSG